MLTYYISDSTGNDSNDGLSEDKPFKTLSKMSSVAFNEDITILLKKDDIFYGKFRVEYNSSLKGHKIYVSSYGEGVNNPTIRYCKHIKTDANWIQESTNIWKLDVTNTSNFTGISDSKNDHKIGFIYDADTKKVYGGLKLTKNELTQQFDFYCESPYIYVYSTVKPSTVMPNMVLPVNETTCLCYPNGDYRNIKSELCAGIAFGLSPAVSVNENIKIIGCEANLIGGYKLSDTNNSRYGNGIELYIRREKPIRNIYIANNKIRGCYDVGFTMQGTDGICENVVVENNIFMENSQDSEIWTSVKNSTQGDKTKGIFNCVFRNNICINSGRGWASTVRPNKNTNCNILFFNTDLYGLDYTIENNIFYNPTKVYYINEAHKAIITSKIKSRNNYIFLDKDSYIMYGENYNADNFSQFVTEHNQEIGSIVNKITDGLTLGSKISNMALLTNYAKTLAESTKREVNSIKGKMVSLKEIISLCNNNNNDNNIYTPKTSKLKSSGGNSTGYIKIATFTITSQYRNALFKLNIIEGEKSNLHSCDLLFKLRQNNAMGSVPDCILHLDNVTGTLCSTNNFIAVITQNNSSATVVDLYYVISEAYTTIYYKEDYNIYNMDDGTVSITYSDGQTIITELPSGKQIIPS